MKKATKYITTFTGIEFYPLEPDIDKINITDIAHHLALTNRFGGATRFPYSVAQHSCLLATQYIDAKTSSKEYNERRYALLHDASEAYLNDITRPIKESGELKAYLKYEKILQDMIFERFDLDPKRFPEYLHAADHDLGIAEGIRLVNGHRATRLYEDNLNNYSIPQLEFNVAKHNFQLLCWEYNIK